MSGLKLRNRRLSSVKTATIDRRNAAVESKAKRNSYVVDVEYLNSDACLSFDAVFEEAAGIWADSSGFSLKSGIRDLRFDFLKESESNKFKSRLKQLKKMFPKRRIKFSSTKTIIYA